MVGVRIICADVLDGLRGLADESVQCVVTSPPYWGLRDYGVAGQLGLEKTPEEYVARMVAVFAQVRRVLRKDGTLWLNMGDCYSGAPPGNARPDHSGPRLTGTRGEQASTRARAVRALRDFGEDLKPKDLVGIPWRLAFALQADGWWLRSDIVWHKPNPMPESATDRPTKAHEYVFLMAKAERYYYDAGAIRTPFSAETKQQSFDTMDFQRRVKYANGAPSAHRNDKQRGHGRRHAGFDDRWDAMTKDEQTRNGANARSVWTIATQPYSEAHFATFPEELPRRCILAGCPAGGTVLDPFGGAGTTGLVAARLGRDAIVIELNPKYARMAAVRIERECPLMATVRLEGVPPGVVVENESDAGERA